MDAHLVIVEIIATLTTLVRVVKRWFVVKEIVN